MRLACYTKTIILPFYLIARLLHITNLWSACSPHRTT